MSTVLTVMFILNHLTIPVLAVTGQHDRYFHSKDLSNTPIGLLQEAGCLSILENEEMLGVYGCGWEGELPVKEKGNILLIHKAITAGAPPFFLPDAISSMEAADMFSGFNYVVSGDYHVPFSAHNVLNCGSMMRQNIDQKDHKPRVFLVGSGSSVDVIRIPIAPAEEVFDETAEKREVENEELKAFIAGLSGNAADRPSFESTLNTLMNGKEVSRGARTILKEVLSHGS